MIKLQLENRLLLKQNFQLFQRMQYYKKLSVDFNTQVQTLQISLDNVARVLSGLQYIQHYLNQKSSQQKGSFDQSPANNQQTNWSEIVVKLALLAEKKDSLSNQEADRLMEKCKSYIIEHEWKCERLFKMHESKESKIDAYQQNEKTQQSPFQCEEKKQVISCDLLEKIVHLKEEINPLSQQLLAANDQEIIRLKQEIEKLSRRFNLLLDFNPNHVELVIKQDNFQCYCGGLHLQFMSKSMNDILLKMQDQQKNIIKNQESGLHELDVLKQTEAGVLEKKQEEVEGKINKDILSNEQLLRVNQELGIVKLKNNKLLERLEKLKISTAVSQESILHSQAYKVLQNQCYELIQYCSTLTAQLRKSYIMVSNLEEDYKNLEAVAVAEANNKEVKRKPQRQSQEFASLMDCFTNLRNYCKEMIQKEGLKHNLIKESKEIVEDAQKLNESLKEQLKLIYDNNIQKLQKLPLRREAEFKRFMETIQKLLKSVTVEEYLVSKDIDIKQTVAQWEAFLRYFQSRDGLINNLKDKTYKLEKELLESKKLNKLFEKVNEEAENNYYQNKFKLDQIVQKMQTFSEKIYQLDNYCLIQKLDLQFKIDSQFKKRTIVQEKEKCIKDFQVEFFRIQKLYASAILENEKYMENNAEKQRKYLLSIKNLQYELKESQNINTEASKRLKFYVNETNKSHHEKESLYQKIHNLESSEGKNIELMTQLDKYRKKITCICNKEHQIEVSLKTCPHLFCKACIDNATNFRNRKCPICSTKFTASDVHSLKLN